ncbi:MAG TPA: hypothetical protein VFN32_04900 [Rhodococcus sp. (in: high G+C Gram-positive bacteria)]|nr:hypothetical protein [Rhodococcus sp. (in: high G+C Gram-positive bacteria)]
MNSPRTGPTASLEAGARGLDFFAAYLPHAHSAGIADRITVEGLRARYEEQIGLDMSVLADDAAVLTRLASDLDSLVTEQSGGVRALRSAWQGDVGDLAHDDLHRAVQRGAMLHDTVDALARTCTDAVESITRAVDEKANAIGRFADMSVAGRTPEDIGTIIAGTGGDGGPTIGQVALWCAEAGTPAPEPAGVAAWCERWLDEVFAPTMQSRIDRFIEVCDSAHDTVDRHLGAIARSFDLLDTPVPASEPARQLGGGPLGTADTTGGPDDILGAATDLVDAGRELVGAVADLTSAVAELATAAAEGAAVFTEAVASGISRPGVEGFEPPPGPAVQAGPADAAVQAGPADAGVQAGPAGPAVFVPKSAESGPAPQPPSTPQEPPSSQDAWPPAGPMVAQAPTESRAANRRTGVNSGAAATDPVDTESPEDDGVVLAEAGPL